MSKERKINIALVILFIMALLLEFYLNKYYILLIAILLEGVFVEAYEKKTGIKLLYIKNKKLRLFLIILCIALIIFSFLSIIALTS